MPWNPFSLCHSPASYLLDVFRVSVESMGENLDHSHSSVTWQVSNSQGTLPLAFSLPRPLIGQGHPVKCVFPQLPMGHSAQASLLQLPLNCSSLYHTPAPGQDSREWEMWSLRKLDGSSLFLLKNLSPSSLGSFYFPLLCGRNFPHNTIL